MKDLIKTVLSCRYLGCATTTEVTSKIGEPVGSCHGASVEYDKSWTLDSRGDLPVIPTHGWCPRHNAVHPRMTVVSETADDVGLLVAPEVLADLELDTLDGPRPRLEEAVRGIGFDPRRYEVRQDGATASLNLRLARMK